MSRSVVAGIVLFVLSGAALAGSYALRAPTAEAGVAPPAPLKKMAVRADGRVAARPGARVTLSAEIGGTVAKILVKEGTHVARGDVLLEFKRKSQSAALVEASAAASEASAQLRARSNDVKRLKSLVTSGAIAKHDLETMNEQRTLARSRVTGAAAAAARLRADLERTQVLAPIDGVVVARSIEEHEGVTPGTPLFTIVDLARLRVEAEIDEFDVGRVAIGNKATISADGLPGQSWTGTIEEIPDIVAPRRLNPLDPSRPTDTAVLLAKLSLPEGTPLKLGQRVRLELDRR